MDVCGLRLTIKIDPNFLSTCINNYALETTILIETQRPVTEVRMNALHFHGMRIYETERVV